MKQLHGIGWRVVDHGIVNAFAHRHRAHRHHGVGDALGHGHDVRQHVKGLRGEGVAGAAEAGDDFVEDQQQIVFVADFAQALEITFRRNQHACRARHRLDDHGGDVGGIVCGDDARFEFIGEMRAPIGFAARKRVFFQVVGVGQMIDARQHAAVHFAIGRHAAHRYAAEAHAVIAAFAADEDSAMAFTARAVIGQCNFQRGIHGLGAGVAEEHMIQIARQHFCQTVGHAK